MVSVWREPQGPSSYIMILLDHVLLFKVVALVMSLQFGYIRFGCFLNEVIKEKKIHYIKKEWLKCEPFMPREKNVGQPPLVNSDNIIIHPFHINRTFLEIKSLITDEKCEDR